MRRAMVEPRAGVRWLQRPQRRVGAGLLGGIALLVAGCGDTQTPTVEPAGASGASVVAPECREVDRLAGVPAEDAAPAGTKGSPQPYGGADKMNALGNEIERWGQREAVDSYAGVWVDQELFVFAVAFARDVDRYAAEVRERFHPGLAIAEANHPQAELRDIQERIQRQSQGQFDEPGAIRGVDVLELLNRTGVWVFDPGEARLAELSATYGATAICFEVEEPPAPPTDGVETLAKASGWRDQLPAQPGPPSAVFEVAYDRRTAQAAWRDNVPADLRAREGELPAEPGVYGDLDQVDFGRQAVVVWSSSVSGCPEWLVDIGTVDGVIRIEQDETGHDCGESYSPYRILLAVDRDRLPSPGELGSARLEGVPDGLVSAYPHGQQ